jgi:hypothetical protein
MECGMEKNRMESKDIEIQGFRALGAKIRD